MKVTLLLLLYLPYLFKFKLPLTRTSATARGHMNLLPLLISSGAHLDHVYIVNDKSKIIETCTALHLAVTAGQLDAVKLLVQSGSLAPTFTHVCVRLSVSVPSC